MGVNNGTIWGTPTVPQTLTEHTIFIENTSGWDEVILEIRVLDILANISYPSSSYTFIRNRSIGNLNLSNLDGGNVDTISISPQLPIGLSLENRTQTAAIVSLGTSHTCAVLDDGSLKCWGYNYYGELGIGSTTTQTTPQTVDLGTGRTAVSVSLGGAHTCAVLE